MLVVVSVVFGVVDASVVTFGVVSVLSAMSCLSFYAQSFIVNVCLNGSMSVMSQRV